MTPESLQIMSHIVAHARDVLWDCRVIMGTTGHSLDIKDEKVSRFPSENATISVPYKTYAGDGIREEGLVTPNWNENPIDFRDMCIKFSKIVVSHFDQGDTALIAFRYFPRIYYPEPVYRKGDIQFSVEYPVPIVRMASVSKSELISRMGERSANRFLESLNER